MYNVASYLWIHLLYLATHIHIRPEVQTPEPQYFLPSQIIVDLEQHCGGMLSLRRCMVMIRDFSVKLFLYLLYIFVYVTYFVRFFVSIKYSYIRMYNYIYTRICVF